jgi:hypothetical protein
MATATLKRVKLPKPVKASEETKQLAREARLILGYDSLHDEVIDGQESLSTVLRRLGIEPFSWTTVHAYQEKKRAEVNKKGNGYHYWSKRLISAASNVPPFVLRKAIQIKLACPKVKLYVEGLENHPDPFLIATLDREEFYIDVWDEKDFEAKL